MLYISDKLIRAMEQEAQRAYPRECCGVIFGRLDGQAKYAESLRPSENSFEEGEQYHRFRITAEQMLGAWTSWDFITPIRTVRRCPQNTTGAMLCRSTAT